jgi:transposase
MALTEALELREGDRERLGDLVQRTAMSSELARRAQIVLLAADGMANAQIARTVGVSRPTVIGWRDRYRHAGIAGLNDEPRSGRPREIDDVDVVVATLADGGRPPARLGVSHWSARLLAAELGISFASVARIWRKWGIRPNAADSFALGTDPGIVLSGHRVAGLYLDPARDLGAVALADSAPGPSAQWLPREPARSADGEYGQPGAAALVTALAGANGQTQPGDNSPGHEPHDLARFLARLAVSRPCAQFRLVTDNRALGDQDAVRYWLAGSSPQFTLHSATADCPWLTVVEIVFGVSHAGDGACRVGKDVTAAIGRYYGAGSQKRVPFAWINPLQSSARRLFTEPGACLATSAW